MDPKFNYQGRWPRPEFSYRPPYQQQQPLPPPQRPAEPQIISESSSWQPMYSQGQQQHNHSGTNPYPPPLTWGSRSLDRPTPNAQSSNIPNPMSNWREIHGNSSQLAQRWNPHSDFENHFRFDESSTNRNNFLPSANFINPQTNESDVDQEWINKWKEKVSTSMKKETIVCSTIKKNDYLKLRVSSIF